MDTQNSKNFSVTQYVLTGLLIIGAFFLGMLWTKVQYLENTDKSDDKNVVVDNNKPTAPTEQAPRKVKPVSKDDRYKGDITARYALVEYSDIDCPFCKRFHPTAQKFLDENKAEVVWVYRHFPLDSLHPTARRKAEAAECVYKLGGNDKFWKFLDALTVATDTTLTNISKTAKDAGVNETAFKTCYDANETKQIVNDFASSGDDAGITGTPGNILLDTKTGEMVVVPGAVPYETLVKYFNDLKAKSSK